MFKSLFKEKDKNYNEIIYNLGYKNLYTKTFLRFLYIVSKTNLYNKFIKFKNVGKHSETGFAVTMLILLIMFNIDMPKNILVMTNNEKEIKNLISLFQNTIKEVKEFDNLYITIFGNNIFKFNTGLSVQFAPLKSKYDVDSLMIGKTYDYIIYANLDFNDIEIDLNYHKIKKLFSADKRTDTLQILVNK